MRVLVVEDHPANRELMVYLLRSLGHEAVAAPDGEEVLRQASELQPDLIVCDLQLPTFDGYELLERLRGIPSLRRIPVVAVTAFAMVGDRGRALAAGFDGYISKPISPDTFVQELETLEARVRKEP